MFQKIIVIGSPGSGKSVFSRKLRNITGLPLHHLDLLWHKPDKTNYTAEEFDKKLQNILSSDKWIIDGNYQRTLETRLASCDTAFLLDYQINVCLSGAESRIGRKRDDMPWTETELDDKFRQWIIDFPKIQLPAIYQLLKKYSDKTIIIFKSREESESYLDHIQTKMNL